MPRFGFSTLICWAHASQPYPSTAAVEHVAHLQHEYANQEILTEIYEITSLGEHLNRKQSTWCLMKFWFTSLSSAHVDLWSRFHNWRVVSSPIWNWITFCSHSFASAQFSLGWSMKQNRNSHYEEKTPFWKTQWFFTSTWMRCEVTPMSVQWSDDIMYFRSVFVQKYLPNTPYPVSVGHQRKSFPIHSQPSADPLIIKIKY